MAHPVTSPVTSMSKMPVALPQNLEEPNVYPAPSETPATKEASLT